MDIETVFSVDEFNFNGVSVYSFKTYPYANRVFTLILVQKPSLAVQEIVLVNTVFTSSKFKDIKAGDFNYGLLKVPERTPFNIFIGYVQIKNKPGAIS